MRSLVHVWKENPPKYFTLRVQLQTSVPCPGKMKQKKVNEDLLFCDSKKNKMIAIKGKFLPSVSKISCSNRVVSIPV